MNKAQGLVIEWTVRDYAKLVYESGWMRMICSMCSGGKMGVMREQVMDRAATRLAYYKKTMEQARCPKQGDGVYWGARIDGRP
jgi:hypothetical protein